MVGIFPYIDIIYDIRGKYGYDSVHIKEIWTRKRPYFSIFHPVRSVTTSVMLILILHLRESIEVLRGKKQKLDCIFEQ